MKSLGIYLIYQNSFVVLLCGAAELLNHAFQLDDVGGGFVGGALLGTGVALAPYFAARIFVSDHGRAPDTREKQVLVWAGFLTMTVTALLLTGFAAAIYSAIGVETVQRDLAKIARGEDLGLYTVLAVMTLGLFYFAVWVNYGPEARKLADKR